MYRVYPLSHSRRAFYSICFSAGIIGAALVFSAFWIFAVLPLIIENPAGAVWIVFAILSGVMASTTPSVFPVVPILAHLAQGKYPLRAVRFALEFGVGSALSLMSIGALAGLLGETVFAIPFTIAPVVSVWAALLLGIVLYISALGSMGLVHFRMPAYLGSAPKFVQTKNSPSPWRLGAFLGMIGVGAPSPVLLALFLVAVLSGSVWFGVVLFFMHAVGRMLVPLLLACAETQLAGILRAFINHRDRLERAAGWGMLGLSSIILVFAGFSGAWWAKYSGFPEALGIATPMVEPSATGFFGQPAEWGNWFLVALWVVPILLHGKRVWEARVGRVRACLRDLEYREARMREERSGLEVAMHIPDAAHRARYFELEKRIEALEKERRVLESFARWGASNTLKSPRDARRDETLAIAALALHLCFALLLLVLVGYYLPSLSPATKKSAEVSQTTLTSSGIGAFVPVPAENAQEKENGIFPM